MTSLYLAAIYLTTQLMSNALITAVIKYTINGTSIYYTCPFWNIRNLFPSTDIILFIVCIPIQHVLIICMPNKAVHTPYPPVELTVYPMTPLLAASPMLARAPTYKTE